MCHLFFIKLKHSVYSTKLLSLIILMSTVASLFCVNVMLGYAEDLYRSSYDASWYSTICITNIPDQYDEIKNSIASTHQYEVGSVLAFTKVDNIIVVGWDGTDSPDRWFPGMSGKFFSEEQLAGSEDIAYLSYDLYSDMEEKSKISIYNNEYDVIGYGWIIGYNFEQAIGKNSSQSIIDSSDEKNYYMVIPRLTYEKQEYIPEMLLMHINEISNKQLGNLVESLQEEFPTVEFTQSDNNSDIMRTSEKIKYVPFGIVLAIFIGISLVQMFAVWFDETRDVSKAYVICGMPRKKMIFLMSLEILFFVVCGEGIALLIQWLTIPILTYMGVSYMPNFGDVFVTATAAFLILVILMLKKIIGNAGMREGSLS